MSDWKEFFKINKDFYVYYTNKGWRGRIDIEDLYQAFKARIIDEVEASKIVGEDGGSILTTTEAIPLKEKEEWTKIDV